MTQQEEHAVDPADDGEQLAEREPVELVEVDEPSGTPPAAHGEWVDADPDDPELDRTGCDGAGDQGDAGAGVA
jgi:hypothetical protein